MGDSHLLNLLDTVTCRDTICDYTCAIDANRYFFNLLLYAVFFLISKPQRLRGTILYCIRYQMCQLYSAFSAFDKSIIHGKAYFQSLAMLAHQLDFLIRITSKTIICHHNRLSELPEIMDMLVQVAQSFFQTFHIRLFQAIETYASVHFQSLRCSDNHRQTRTNATLTAFDVIEFLSSQICSESGLRNHIIAKSHRHFGSKNGVASMSYIGKRSAMYESGSAFGCLHQIRMNGIFQQHGYGSRYSQIFHRKRFVVEREAEQYILNPATQVGNIFCKT